MTTALVHFRVADFEAWRAGYTRAVEADTELRSSRIWRGQDDPNLIVVAETFDTREVAEAALTSQVTRDMMANDGIELSSVRIEYFDEVVSGTP